ncbi:MAG TPA: hypothetical protein VHV78_14220 [Gemmatimonadaceae bacterium]|jgi:hypothetical protein|nr:hypothetical protein [Gemmatimonadaceae bacterium]
MIDEPTHTHDSLASLVRAVAPASFDAGFTERVLVRLHAEREASVSRALERQFRRVVPLLAAAALVMAAFNWWSARGTARSPIDAALNLPQVSVAAAYDSSFDDTGTMELQ